MTIVLLNEQKLNFRANIFILVNIYTKICRLQRSDGPEFDSRRDGFLATSFNICFVSGMLVRRWECERVIFLPLGTQSLYFQRSSLLSYVGSYNVLSDLMKLCPKILKWHNHLFIANSKTFLWSTLSLFNSIYACLTIRQCFMNNSNNSRKKIKDKIYMSSFFEK